MIPWRITLETTTLPDQIINKLAEITDTTINSIRGTFEVTEEVKKKNKFGGKVNANGRSFRLFLYPYERSTYKYKGTIYQGKVVESGGRSKIILWVRPSLLGLFYYSLITLSTVMALWRTITGELNEDLGVLAAILLAIWAYIIYSTLREIRYARKLFDSISTNKPFPF